MDSTRAADSGRMAWGWRWARVGVWMWMWMWVGWGGGVGGALGQGVGPAAQSVDGLSQTEAGQQQLRATTGRVGEVLGVIIDEFARSGLGGEDVQLLQSIRGLLGHLSEEDMVRVVTLLQQAREVGGGTGGVGRGFWRRSARRSRWG